LQAAQALKILGNRSIKFNGNSYRITMVRCISLGGVHFMCKVYFSDGDQTTYRYATYKDNGELNSGPVS
jgi:hypothetical protein